jgi:chloramphenicol 3-O-phosphotransferase
LLISAKLPLKVAMRRRRREKSRKPCWLTAKSKRVAMGITRVGRAIAYAYLP